MNRWLVGALGTGVLGAAAARRHGARRSAAELERELIRPGPGVDLRGDRLRLPVAFHRADGFLAIVGADLRQVRDTLPTDALVPVRLPGGRAAVMVGVYRYHEITMHAAAGGARAARPYGELVVAALVTRRPSPPVVPLLIPARFGVGGFILHLPVTTRLAQDAGRALFGMPKFVADMDFTDDEPERAVTVAEGGRTILTLRVRPSGRPVAGRTSTVLYSVLDGTLLETVLPGAEVRRGSLGGFGGSVELGDHEVANDLRRLGLGWRPFATETTLSSRFVMPAGRPIGPARDYHGYAGVERDFGRYTVRHAGTPPIDLNADRRPLEWWTVDADLPAPADRPGGVRGEGTTATAR